MNVMKCNISLVNEFLFLFTTHLITYNRKLYFHVSVIVVFHDITVVLSGILIEKCSSYVYCQFNANSGAIDQLIQGDQHAGHPCE